MSLPENAPHGVRHVLLVNYFFPPMTGGGVPRPVKMAKYLSRLGWSVTVLSVDAAGGAVRALSVDPATDVVRAREWRVGLLLRAVGGAVRFARRRLERRASRTSTGPSLLERGFAFEEHEIEASKIGWVLPAVRAAMGAHARRPIDVAVVSLPPGAAGTVGWLLRRLRGVPYVVEYRDPWTIGAFWAADADGVPRTDLVTRSRLRLTRGLEARLLRASAGAVVVNGPAHLQRLADAFPAATAGKPVVHIRNGVDLEDVAAAAATTHATDGDGPLRLLHTGFFYHHYTPHHLITALRLVQRDHPDALTDVELDFMGAGFPDGLVRETRSWGLDRLIRISAAGSHASSLAAMATADGLITVLPPVDSDHDRLPTKIYEYLATDRPVLVVAHPDGALAELLDGVPDVVLADNRDQDAIAAAFAAFVALARRRRADGRSPDTARRGAAHHYHERAVQMDVLLHGVLGRPHAVTGSASRYGEPSNPG